MRRDPERNKRRREIALQWRSDKISLDEYLGVLYSIPMKTRIIKKITSYSSVGRPRTTKNKKNKKLVLPKIKRNTKSNILIRQRKDLIK